MWGSHHALGSLTWYIADLGGPDIRTKIVETLKISLDKMWLNQLNMLSIVLLRLEAAITDK